MYYFIVLFILFNSTVRVLQQHRVSKSIVAILSLYGINVLYIIVVLSVAIYRSIKGIESKFCTDIVWLLIRIGHLSSTFLLFILARMLSRSINKIIIDYDLEKQQNARQDIFRLWIIIIINTIEAIIHSLIDLSVLISQPADCHVIVGNKTGDAILWFMFRWLSVNLWVVVNLYVFNTRKLYTLVIKKLSSTVSDNYTALLKSKGNSELDDSYHSFT